MRWLAAFAVWLHHMPPPVACPPWLDAMIRELHVGVSAFFVLSGFLITLRYSDAARLNRRWIVRYTQNRVARIYPVYFLMTIATLVVVPVLTSRAVDAKVLALNLTLLRGLFDDYKSTGVAQGWTLTVEEFFYFSAPLVFVAWRSRRWAGPISTTLVMYLAGLVLWRIGDSIQAHGFFSPFRFVLLYTFFGRAFEFFVGAWLARRVLARDGVPTSHRPFPLLTLFGGVGTLLSVFLLSLGRGDHYEYGFENPSFIPIHLVLVPCMVACLIAGLIFERSALSKFLGSGPLVLLGKASYCFYLLHKGIVIAALHRAAPAWVGTLPGYLFQLFVVVGLSVALYKGVEHPLNRRIRDLRL